MTTMGVKGLTTSMLFHNCELHRKSITAITASQ